MYTTDHTRAPKGVLHKPWEHAALKALSFGGLASAGLALSPLIFPAFTVNAVAPSGSAIAACSAGPASGWAGAVYNALGGGSILSGGWATAALAGGLAIGGLWLANYIDKRTEQGQFRWGSVIRWAALGTSMLIALPAILTGISMGLNFFGLWSGNSLLMSAAGTIGSLGTAGAAGSTTAVSAAALSGIHALTCALPLGVTSLFLGKKEEPRHPPMPQLQLPIIKDGKVTLPLPPLRAAT